VGGGGDINRSGCFFPPTPVLAARANNNDDKDSRITVEETREKTRGGRRALIIAPWPRDGGRSACLLRRDMVGDGGGAFGFWCGDFWVAWAGAVSNPVAFVTFVVEVVPPPLRGEGGRAGRGSRLVG
jgi:hypothetical protein